MKLNDIVKRIPVWYQAGMCVYLRGRIGRGKSTVIEGAAAQLCKLYSGNYGVVVVNGPLLNPPDAVGYLMPERRGEWLMSLFTQPFWFVTTEGKHISEYDGGIVLVDEADKMDTDVKKVIGEAALSGRLGPHVLPGFTRAGKSTKGWRMWMAGNRLEDRSGSTKEYDHLINRRMEIEVDDDLQSAEDWMLSNGVHPAFVTFMVQNPQIVLAENLPAKQGPFCTPRSLTQAASYVQDQMEGDELPTDPIIREEVSGMIGEDAVAQLFATLELAKQMPKYEEIVTKPKTAKCPTAPDAQMLVCYSLAAKVKAAELGPVIEYVERMPPEFTVMFGRAAVRRDTSLVATKAFGEWTKRNASLMMAITSI